MNMNELKKIHAAIIEDEYPAARLLNEMLSSLRPEWEITLLPGSINESVKWFSENPHPDILFLDIQLTDGNSFMFLEQAQPDSMVIFTTAYDEYAIRAFAVNSIDYLLKPINTERLQVALTKFERLYSWNLRELNRLLNIKELIKTLSDKSASQFRTRILITGPKRFYTIQINEVAYFYTENKITFAVTKDGKKHVLDLTLGKLEEELDYRLFFRVNRQFILCANSIKSIEPYNNNKLNIKVFPYFEGAIPVSREKITALKIWLNS